MANIVGGLPSTELLLQTPREIAPSLQGEALRIGVITGGAMIGLYGLAKGGWLGLGALVAGSAAMLASDRVARRPWARRWHAARASITVLADADALYEHLMVERLADVLSVVSRVEADDDDRLVIWLRGRGGPELAWHVRLLADAPGRRVAWRALPGSPVPGDGEIRLLQAPGGRGVEVHVRILLGPPAAYLGAVAAGRVERSGERGHALADDLRRLKQLVEAGEVATTEGQPRGGGVLRRAAAQLTRRVSAVAEGSVPIAAPLEAR